METDGTVLGVSVGTARIRASIGSGLAWIDRWITPTQVASLRLEPATLTLRAGEAAVVRAVALGGRGGSLTGIPVAWESSDPTVATMGDDGLVTALRFGLARIAATAGGRRATLPVEVRPTRGIGVPQIRPG